MAAHVNRPKMREYYFDTAKYSGPKTWDELSPAQLAEACAVIDARMPFPWKAEMLIPVLMGIRSGRVLIDFEDALEATRFLFGEAGRTKAPFPRLRTGALSRTLYPPADGLANIAFDEFIVADTEFMAYCGGAGEERLDRLCACLLRPMKSRAERKAIDYNGDPREAFNSNTLSRRLPGMAKVPRAKKLAVLAFFAGCKAKWARQFPILFKKAEGGKAGGSWLIALQAFTDNITQYQAVLETRANLVLFDMAETAKQAERAREQAEAAAAKNRR